MIVACVALFLALGGTGYAAGHLSTGGDKERASKQKDQAKRGPRGKRGLRGPQGLPGPVGPVGPVGPKGAEAIGLLDYEVAEEASPPEATEFGSVQCPPGLNLVGGGVRPSSAEQRVVSSYPATVGNVAPGGNRWNAEVSNPTNEAKTFSVFAICARTSAVAGNLIEEP
jgi:hypothetical protein